MKSSIIFLFVVSAPFVACDSPGGGKGSNGPALTGNPPGGSCDTFEDCRAHSCRCSDGDTLTGSLCVDLVCMGPDDACAWACEQNGSSWTGSNTPVACNEFRCNDGQCIDDDWKCDGEADCDGGEDELGCGGTEPSGCSLDEASCGDGQCIPSDWRCDGEEDCASGVDEMACF